VRKKKIRTRRVKVKKPNKIKRVIPLNEKILANDIGKYPYVEVEWVDIEGDDGWVTLKSLREEKLPIAVSRGYLVSQKNGVTRIFRDYIKSKTRPVFEDIGSTVIIPTSVIISIKKITLCWQR